MRAITESLNPIRRPTLFELTEQTHAALAAIEPDPETGELIGVETFDALALDTQEKLIDCSCAVANFDGLVDQLDEQIKALQARKKAVQKISDHVKERVVDAMEVLGIKSITAAPVKISLRASTSVEVFDESMVPINFKYIPPVEPKISKTAINQAIKAGQEVPGARLVKKNNLLVK